MRIHAQIRGEGEPLLLYSGIWGEVGLWEQLLPHLDGFRTIAFDPPGIGQSQMPCFSLTMWALARFGTAVLDELGIQSAHALVLRSVARSHSKWRSPTPAAFACWCRRRPPSAASPSLAASKLPGIPSTRAAIIRNGWNGWPC